jgi:hypothetical protein
MSYFKNISYFGKIEIVQRPVGSGIGDGRQMINYIKANFKLCGVTLQPMHCCPSSPSLQLIGLICINSN